MTSAEPSGNGWAYDAETNILALNNFSSTTVYSGEGAGNAVIRYTGTADLTISFTGDNTLDASGSAAAAHGMFSNGGKLTLCEGEGGGSLTCSGTSTNWGAGILLNGSAEVTVSSGTVTVSGQSGFSGKTHINGGEVTAIATGASEGAINGNYTNAIPGEAWNNPEGTGDSTGIETLETLTNGWGYKRMYFTVPYIALTGTAPTVTMTKAAGNTEEGVPQIGDTLTAIPDPAKAKPVTYQWYRGTAAIEGATASTYEVVADDVDSTLHAVITQAAGADGASSPEVTATSANTTAAKKKDSPAAPANAAAASFVINYPAETFTVNDAYEVSTSQSSDGVISDGSLRSAIDGDGKVYIRTKETNDVQAGAWLEVQLASRPAAPTTEFNTVNATNGSTTDGEIIGTGDAMEYKLKDGEGGWTAASNDKTTGLAAGTYLVRTKATAENPASKTAEVTVESKQIVLTDGQKPTAKTGLKYDGTTQDLLNAPAEALPEGAAGLRYALGQDATNAPDEGWDETAPTGKEAGTYYVWYKAASDADHVDSVPACLTVEIAKADSTVVKAPEATNPTYNGKAQALVTAGTAEGGTMKYSLDGKTFSEEVPTGTDAKAYTVWYKVAGDGNHNDTEPQKVTSTISKKDEPKPEPSPEPKPGPAPVKTFPDVPEDAWFHGVVYRAAGLGLFNGYDNGNFGPNDNVTRGQTAVVLWHMAGHPAAGTGAKQFPDVKAKAYYADAVAWASSVGVVNGYKNGNFGPDDNITREQLAAMLANYARNVGGRDTTGSADDYKAMKDAAKVSGWAESSVGWCFRNKIMSGTKDGNVNPQGNATRAETAKMTVFLHDMLQQ